MRKSLLVFLIILLVAPILGGCAPIGTDLDTTGMGITTVRVLRVWWYYGRITHTPDTGLTTAHITDMDTGITTVHIVDTTNTEDTVEAQGGMSRYLLTGVCGGSSGGS